MAMTTQSVAEAGAGTLLEMMASSARTIYLAIHPSVYLSICLSVYLSVCLYKGMCRPLYLHLRIYIYISTPTHLHLRMYPLFLIYLKIYIPTSKHTWTYVLTPGSPPTPPILQRRFAGGPVGGRCAEASLGAGRTVGRGPKEDIRPEGSL